MRRKSGSYSGEGSECGDWRDDPGLRGLSASEDGSECDGWRRELGADEVCENYMDAKFGGEDAEQPWDVACSAWGGVGRARRLIASGSASADGRQFMPR